MFASKFSEAYIRDPGNNPLIHTRVNNIIEDLKITKEMVQEPLNSSESSPGPNGIHS